MDVTIRPEVAADRQAMFDVHASAFDSDGEARLVDALRGGGYVVVSLVAVAGRVVVGHILFSRLTIETDAATIPALALAPMAVRPEWQRRGIGSRLVEEGLARVGQLEERVVIVLGHPGYYPRFGFSPELAVPLQSPFSGAAWMALELVPGALAGVAGDVHYPPPFGIEAVGDS